MSLFRTAFDSLDQHPTLREDIDNRESRIVPIHKWGAGSPITCEQWSTFGSKNTCDSTQSSILWTWTNSFRSYVVGTKTVNTLNLRSGTFSWGRANLALRHVSGVKGVLMPFVWVDVSNRVYFDSDALTELRPAPEPKLGKLENFWSQKGVTHPEHGMGWKRVEIEWTHTQSTMLS